MILSKTGVIATILWNEIPKHHNFVELGDFVVMPNHVHGILIINKPFEMNNQNGVDEMDDIVDQQYPDHQQQSKNQNKSSILPGSKRFQNIGKNTISSVVGSYKSAVTKYANRLGFPNGWQRLFHEHIIRNEIEYQRISNYIINNPIKWNEDKFCNPTSSK